MEVLHLISVKSQNMFCDALEQQQQALAYYGNCLTLLLKNGCEAIWNDFNAFTLAFSSQIFQLHQKQPINKNFLRLFLDRKSVM